MSDKIGMTQYDAAHNGHEFATKIRDHQPVVGSDGEPVGTVDAVEGDRIKLTRQDPEAGGKHHYIPLTAVANVDHSVRLAQPAADVQRMWQEGDGGSEAGLR
jgi:hypothetical protein